MGGVAVDVTALEVAMEDSLNGEAVGLPRIGYSTAEVARALGRRPDALRRQCERCAERGPNGELVARLDLDVIGRKRGGRWVFTVPAELIPRRG